MSDFPRRMVYVDDEPHSRRVVKEGVGGSDDDPYFLVTCATGRELIARFHELQPDLILLDLRMPDMNGPDTIEELRKTPGYNHPAVIFVTDRQRVKMIDEYRALGVIGVIRKPLEASKIRAQIAHLWKAHKAARSE